ncbi:hypothetical protein BDN71DRAFT_1440354 [Pleurotus eryngii]|uniref:Uncharacterized protein n=1 Tax=Pleurotus eryngii TaxID=5323 RepID=A0A9P6A665_PLEER|nr:hypothetical protein BDN71DRAFT_1440354 [Pleurotus eryngii]
MPMSSVFPRSRNGGSHMYAPSISQVLDSHNLSQLRVPTRSKVFSRYHPYPYYTDRVSCDPLMQTIDERDESPAYQDARRQAAPHRPRNGADYGQRQGFAHKTNAAA